MSENFLLIDHRNLPFPCGHDVEEHATANWKEDEFSIFIDYKTNRTDSDEVCPVNLEFTLDVIEAGLTPGIYTVACAADESQCDLTEILQ